jgi:hypothetical protein
MSSKQVVPKGTVAEEAPLPKKAKVDTVYEEESEYEEDSSYEEVYQEELPEPLPEPKGSKKKSQQKDEPEGSKKGQTPQEDRDYCFGCCKMRPVSWMYRCSSCREYLCRKCDDDANCFCSCPWKPPYTVLEQCAMAEENEAMGHFQMANIPKDYKIMKTAEIVRSGHVAQEAARRQTILKSERTDREDFWMKRAFELTKYRAKKDRETKTWSDAQLMLRWARENAEVQSSYGQSFQYQDEVRVRMTVGKALRGTIVTCSTTRDAYVVAYENGDVQWFVPADRIRKERP